MPNDNSKTDSTDYVAITLAHLGMIIQAANGSHRPQAGEIEKRAAALISYIRTGQLPASDEDRELIRVIKEFLSSRSDEAPRIEATG